MTSSHAALFSRSTADWASIGSAMTASHSLGSRLEVSTVAGAVVTFDAELVEVGGLGRVERLEREVVDEEQVDTDELAHLGVVAGVESCGLESLVELVGRVRSARRCVGGTRCGRARWRGTSCRRRPVRG